jgi:uridylate kinase
MDKSAVVISVGGSLVVPKEGINIDFLNELRLIVKFLLDNQVPVALVVGGGTTSRTYHKACSSFTHITNQDIDWIGIRAISLNAELVRAIFSDMPLFPQIITDPETIASHNDYPLYIVGAWEPGHSSDTNAVIVAEKLGTNRVINFSNVTHVYDRDPSLYSDAGKLKKITWDEYLKLIPDTWVPNLSSPFDPVASRKAQALGMQVVVLGASTDNLQSYLRNEPFEGTLITP